MLAFSFCLRCGIIGLMAKVGSSMERDEFSRIRRYLGKSQSQLARLLCISPKAIQSFEEGWRPIPAYAERQLLFLLSVSRAMDKNTTSCWEITDCPIKWRENCFVWEFKVRDFCWFLTGTFCQGEYKSSWVDKMKLCRQCKVYQLMIPRMI